MRATKRDGTDERRVVTAMITDPIVLGRISTRWDPQATDGLFSSKWANLIAGWCVKHYATYGAAPGTNIQGHFEAWAARGERSEDLIAPVERLLAYLSDNYDQLGADTNPTYTLDVADTLFNRVKVQRHIEVLQGELDGGDVAAAVAASEAWNKIKLSESSGVDIFSEPTCWERVFQQDAQALVTYPGPVGKFLGKTFSRNRFVSFFGPEKRGKSWWLLDVALRATFQRRRVAFIETGDMSEEQVLERIATRLMKRPLYPDTYHVPTAITLADGANFAETTVEERGCKGFVTYEEAWAVAQEWYRKVSGEVGSHFRLTCHPANTLNVQGLQGMLTSWEREGWVPDMIVIDYADLLAPPAGYGAQQSRDQINATWMALRGMSQRLGCCVVTATQANALSYGVDLLTRSHFTEDKRKLAHVSAMIGINGTDDEDTKCLQRLNFIVRRDRKYNQRRCCHIAGCMSVGKPLIFSHL